MKCMYEELEKLKQKDIYTKFERNWKLFNGKSVDVFTRDVIARVKLEFMGALDSYGNYMEVVPTKTRGGAITYERNKRSVRELIVGNNILQSISRLYVELAANKELTITCSEEDWEFVEDLDFQEEIAESMAIQSYGGKLLLKAVIENNELRFEKIPPCCYFEMNDTEKKYVVFSEQRKDGKETLTCEIYSKNKTEYRYYSVDKISKKLVELEYPSNLETYGCVKDEKGYVLNYEGWQVHEIRNIFNSSDYQDDLITANRELVIGDTLTSQAFDKVANPLLEVGESVVETDDETGESRVVLSDRVIVRAEGEAETKQIQMQTKTDEWKVQRENIIRNVYISTGTNDLAFGISLEGGAVSGESKRRSLERTLSTVETKRNRVFKAYEKATKWAYRYVYGKELEDLRITGKEIISLSMAEKVDIASKNLMAGIMSIESAIEYVNISDLTTDEELSKIKNNLKYKNELLDILEKILRIDSENEVNNQVKNMAAELYKELSLTTEV